MWRVYISSSVPELHVACWHRTLIIGRVRTKTVKKASRVMIERYYSRMTLDFQTNKKIAEEVAIIPSKRLRNKIAGFATHLMKRIQRGPVRGISLKLQEEERERRMDFVPEESAIKTDVIEVDRETIELLAHLNMPQLPGVVQQAAPTTGGGFFKPQGGGYQGNRNRN
uniref:40S ribosomal protein S17 n=2 Tax=Physcomitrium patens TaxID=3218 RepID=A0A7I4EE61_PHYPA